MNQQVVGVKDSICVPVLLRPTLGFLVVLTALSIGIYSSWESMPPLLPRRSGWCLNGHFSANTTTSLWALS